MILSSRLPALACRACECARGATLAGQISRRALGILSLLQASSAGVWGACDSVSGSRYIRRKSCFQQASCADAQGLFFLGAVTAEHAPAAMQRQNKLLGDEPRISLLAMRHFLSQWTRRAGSAAPLEHRLSDFAGSVAQCLGWIFKDVCFLWYGSAVTLSQWICVRRITGVCTTCPVSAFFGSRRTGLPVQ